MSNLLGLFVKHPVAGQVKTRLAADLGDQRAANLYAAFVADLLARFRRCGHRRVLCYAPSNSEARDYFTQLATDDYELWPQPDGNLGDRMAAFFHHFGDDAATQREGTGHPVDEDGQRLVLIGSDSPTLPCEIIESAFSLLEKCDCVLGPATDGGYYLIGQRGRGEALFDDIDWSRHRVLEQTLDRVVESGVRLRLTTPWYDIDTFSDLHLLRVHLRAIRLSGKATDLEKTAPLLDEYLQDGGA